VSDNLSATGLVVDFLFGFDCRERLFDWFRRSAIPMRPKRWSIRALAVFAKKK
jgi:hypothetical protein